MRLVVTDNELEEYGVNIYNLTNDQIRDMAYHPFIATNHWEEACIELTEKTPRNILSQLLTKCPVKLFMHDAETNYGMVQVIAEVNKSKTLELRKAFYGDKENLKEALSRYVTYISSVEEML